MRALELGLVDSLGDIHATLRARFGEDVRTRLIEPKRSLLQLPRLGLGGASLAEGLSSDALATIEDRAVWSRLGL